MSKFLSYLGAALVRMGTGFRFAGYYLQLRFGDVATRLRLMREVLGAFGVDVVSTGPITPLDSAKDPSFMQPSPYEVQ